VAGILGAVATAYIAAAYAPGRDLALFLGLAAAELALAGTVILRVTRRSKTARNRKVLAPSVSLSPLSQLPASSACDQQPNER
jgi:hypothetical protein